MSILVNAETTFIVQGITGREAVNLTRECLDYGAGGIIVPDVIKMGGIGGPAKDAAKSYTPGSVGVISRSGGMTTEMSSTLRAAGLGQSTAVSIGGDAIIGSTYAELMPLFEADEETEAIVIYTEPGGRMEAELAKWVTDNS